MTLLCPIQFWERPNILEIERKILMKKSALLAALFLSLAALVPASAFAKNNHNAYVANNLDATVDVIDTRTDAIVATISSPTFSHPSDMAVSPNGRVLYVRNSNNTFSVVDTETNTVTGTISFGFPVGAPSEGAGLSIAFNRRGDRAYFANSAGNLVIIDVANSSVLRTVPLPAGFIPTSVAVSLDGDNVYVASGNLQGILVIDSDTDTAITTIAAGHLILDLALSPNSEKLYASDSSGLIPPGTNGVLVINTDTNTLEATVPLPGGPAFVTGLAVTPDGRHLYVEDFFFTTRPANSTVTVIDTRDNSIDTTITANGLSLTSLAITTNGRKVLATNAILSTTVHSTVAVIDTRDNTIDDSITVGRFADTIAIQPSNRRHGDDDDRDDDGHGDRDHHGDHDR